MDQIRGLVWNGALNVQIEIDKALIIAKAEDKPLLFNVRIPRDSYISLYTNTILNKIKHYLRKDVVDVVTNIWYEANNQVLLWNIPVTTLYDITNGYDSDPLRVEEQRDNFIRVWKIKMKYGTDLPANHIPIVNGIKQIQTYWMHQWKQASFLLNGSSKRVMSLHMNDTQLFWDSVINRSLESFEEIRNKIIDNVPRNIPIIIHRIDHPDRLYYSKDTNIERANSVMTKTIENLLADHYDSDIIGGIDVLCQGIVIPHNLTLPLLYSILSSFDGFLHIVLVNRKD